MKVATMHNEQSSAPTSPSERQLDVELSEADYLAREVTDAKAALSHSLAQLKIGVANTADLRQWVKHYPWASLGAAAGYRLCRRRGSHSCAGRVDHRQDCLAWCPNSQSDDDRWLRTRRAANQFAEAPTITDNLINSLFDLAKVACSNVDRRRVSAAEKLMKRPDPASTRTTCDQYGQITAKLQVDRPKTR